MEEDIALVLKACTAPKSNEDRLLNEKKIRTFKNDMPELFIFSMTEQLNNLNLDESSRQLAGVLFKNTVKSGEPEAFWFMLSNEQKEELKTRILIPLADDSNFVRLSACS